jgi:hypothetical protein
VLKKQFARISQRHAAGGAIEQTRFQTRLQLRDGMAQRGGRDVEVDGRLAERASTRNRHDGVQFVEADARIGHLIVLKSGIGR